MNKSYIEITKTCKLREYTEGPKERTEVWIDTEGNAYFCKWFYSNNGAIPNTTYMKAFYDK